MDVWVYTERKEENAAAVAVRIVGINHYRGIARNLLWGDKTGLGSPRGLQGQSPGGVLGAKPPEAGHIVLSCAYLVIKFHSLPSSHTSQFKTVKAQHTVVLLSI